MNDLRFGVVIPAKQEHLHWVRGTCASVWHFMEGTPICVILDGELVPDDLARAPGVSVIRRDELEPPVLRSTFGSLRAKNAALWAAPFERFLLLDADAVVWGDMRKVVDSERFDFVLDDGGEPARSVMDIDAVARVLPEFDARPHEQRFANNGAYFGRRGVLDLDEYLELMRLSNEHPGMLYGSQGIFNLMVLRALERGEIRVDRRELQVMTGRTSREELAQRFAFVDSEPRVTGDPVVLHWVGSPKPRVRGSETDYFAPMTYFRRRYRRTARGETGARLSDDLALRIEDMLCTDWRGTNLRGRVARLRRRSGQRYARIKPALRRATPDRVVGLRRNGRARADERPESDQP